MPVLPPAGVSSHVCLGVDGRSLWFLPHIVYHLQHCLGTTASQACFCQPPTPHTPPTGFHTRHTAPTHVPLLSTSLTRVSFIPSLSSLRQARVEAENDILLPFTQTVVCSRGMLRGNLPNILTVHLPCAYRHVDILRETIPTYPTLMYSACCTHARALSALRQRAGGKEETYTYYIIPVSAHTLCTYATHACRTRGSTRWDGTRRTHTLRAFGWTDARLIRPRQRHCLPRTTPSSTSTCRWTIYL